MKEKGVSEEAERVFHSALLVFILAEKKTREEGEGGEKLRLRDFGRDLKRSNNNFQSF